MRLTENHIVLQQSNARLEHGFMAQKKSGFSAKKSSNYLVVPNNLLLSLIGATPITTLLNIFSYARVKHGVSPINKGLFKVPFVQLFMPFCQAAQGGNNDEFRLKKQYK